MVSTTTTLKSESFAFAGGNFPKDDTGITCANAKLLGLRHQNTLAPLSARLTVRRRGIDREPVTIRYGTSHAWFGECFLAWTTHGICWLSIAPDAQALAELEHTWAPAMLLHDPAGTAHHVTAIFDTADSAVHASKVPVHICGSDFQLRVWSALLQIRAGYYVSYGELAHALGTPRAARAVGQAVGANGIAVLVPCHRVLAAGGAMGGYRWGTELKTALLRREAATLAAA